MPPFDARAYEESVVKPLRRWSGRELPDDLVARYAVDLGMSDHELARRLQEVRSKWNMGTGNAGFAGKVYRAFLKADEVLQHEHGADLLRMEWWRSHARARRGAHEDQIEDLARTLRTTFGDLGLITPGQLDATVRAAYLSLSPEEVDDGLRRAEVRRCDPVELPTTSGLVDTTYRHLRGHLIDAGLPTVVELVRGEPATFRLLDQAAAPDLSVAAVRAATDRENKRAGNQAARQALAILSTAAKDGQDLRALALFQLLDDVRQQHGQGVPPAALLKHLLRARLAPEEARLAVFSVLNETGRAPTGNLASVRDLVEQGRLVAAQQVLASIAGAEDAAAATALVERQLAKVRALVDGARRALRAGAEADAAHQLRQAVALAADDEDLRAELRRIPPEPVLTVAAREEGHAVRVSWRPAASHDTATRYRLVRRPGHAPADPDDGVAVTVETDRTVCVDPAAPAGVPVGYAVFAATEGGPWSRPAGTVLEVLPTVGNVVLTFVDGVVDGRWAVHPEAVDVQVRRGDGREIAVTGRTRFLDRTAPEGTEQTYTLVARYRRADGDEVSSAPVRAHTADTGRLRPVRALRLTAAVDAGRPMVTLHWKQQPGSEVVVRRAATPCRFEFGELVSLAEVGGYGQEVTGRRADSDGWQSLTAEVPTGRFHYVPFTVGPGGAVRGHAEQLGIALPVTGLRQQRFGDRVVLAWEWPEQVGVAEVRWRGARGSGHAELTRQQYQSGGGCQLDCGPGRVTVAVRTTVAAEGGECVSPAVELVVPEQDPTITYTVDLSRRPVVGGGTVRVRLRADTTVSGCVVVVVAAQGAVMPRRPADGQVLVRAEHDLTPDQEVVLSAALPRLRKPYWVRCFLETAGLRLVDPSVKQLKVS